MDHMFLAVVFLAVMVLFLICVGLYQIRSFNRMALRIKYLEGTTDMILRILQPE